MSGGRVSADTGDVTWMVRCFTCGLTREIRDLPPPTMPIDVAAAADWVKWLPAFDMPRSRCLVFCTDRCRRDAMTSRGTFRLRSPAIPSQPKPSPEDA